MPESSPITGSRVALFGGSFDPPHAGHLAIARAARQALALDTVLFAPVGSQPLKPLGSTAPYEHRLAMTALAIAGEPGFEVSLIDAPRADGAPNYTIDTLHTLREQMAADAELFCLIGADSLHGLRHWHRAAEVPFAASLVVASRPGEELEKLDALLPAGIQLAAAEPLRQGDGETALLTYTLVHTSGATARIYTLPGLHIDLSATQIRTLLQNESSHSPLVLPEVARYVHLHHLYVKGH